jgi:hypothetical protein
MKNNAYIFTRSHTFIPFVANKEVGVEVQTEVMACEL